MLEQSHVVQMRRIFQMLGGNLPSVGHFAREAIKGNFRIPVFQCLPTSRLQSQMMIFLEMFTKRRLRKNDGLFITIRRGTTKGVDEVSIVSLFPATFHLLAIQTGSRDDDGMHSFQMLLELTPRWKTVKAAIDAG